MKRILGGAAVLVLAHAAMADTYYFGANGPVNNATSAAAGETQLRMDVTNPGSGAVNFRFYWVGSVPMSITDIYFDDNGNNANGGVLDSFISLTGSAGVSYGAGASPPNLPNGGNFITSTNMSADSDSPASGNGVNSSSEYLDIVVDLLGTHTFNDVIAALNQGFVSTSNRGLRVGMHVQAIGAGYNGAGGSESFTNLVVVPLPAAAWAGLSCLAGAMGITVARRRGLGH